MSIFLFALSLFTQFCIWCNTVNSEVSFAESANQFQCVMLENDTLIIKGDNLRFSDFLTSDDFTAFVSNNTLKKIYIFALDTIYIDKDLSAKGQELMIYMIAPKWFVDGTIKFDLRGLNGEPFGKAAEGFDNYGKGNSGSPGKPGGPGGIFFGINGEIINDEFLTIDAGGGDGGKGQDGAQGKNGKNGTRAYIRRDSKENECQDSLCSNNQLIAKNEDGSLETFYCKVKYKRDLSLWLLLIYENCLIWLSGKDPIRPGDGGSGGKCGKGGFPGKITLLQLQNIQTKVRTMNETGKDGELGLGAAPGKESQWGVQAKYSGVRVIVARTIPYIYEKTKWIEEYTKPDPRLPATGKPGKDGGNDENVDPKPALSSIPEYKVINYYKSYLINNLKSTSMHNTLKIFLDEMNYNEKVNELYNATALGEELLMVEKKRVFLFNDVNFLYLYNSLKYRVFKFAEKMDGHNIDQDKKLLSFITTAILSRIYNLKDYSESRLMIDVPVFLDLVYNNIRDLDDLKSKENKLEIVVQKLNKIEKYKDDYKKRLDDRITEAKKVAEEFVNEIHTINNEIDKTVHSLIGEIIALEVDEEKNQELLEKKRNKLQEQMVLRGIFGTIKLVASFGCLLGPIGKVASDTVESMTGVVESIALDSASDNVLIKDLEKRINSSKKMIKKMKKMEIERLNKILYSLREEARDVPKDLDDLSNNVATIQKELKNVTNYGDITKIEQRLGVELDRQREKLMNGTAGHDRAIKILDKFGKITKLVAGAFDLYLLISSDEKSIDVVDAALIESKKMLESLMQLELNVRKVLSPQVEIMEGKIDEIIKKLNKNSRVSLDVTKWKVQELLEKTKDYIYTFVGELNLKSTKQLEILINNLKNTMNILIKVYDHIQNYEDDKYLFDYVADLTSAAATDINITNLEYLKITNQLDITISTNVILQEYAAVINAFKQFVFPMADNYLKYFELPSQLELKHDLDGLVSVSKNQIKLLKTKLKEYQGAIVNDDKCITKGYFYNDHKVTAPFYSWDGEKHEDSFKKMLSGQDITIRADVVNSPASFDALKFTLIKLNFTSRNQTLVKNIKEKLDFFEISMSHLGDSYYRLGNKYYRIDTDITEFSYSYKTESNGEPTFISSSYEKLKNGQLMLSPYALWRIKLRRYSPHTYKILYHSNTNFMAIEKSRKYDENASTGLEAFAKEIIMEMTGKGSFVDVTKKDCDNFNVDKYYKPVNVTY